MVPYEGTKAPLLTPKIAQTIIIQHKIGHKWLKMYANYIQTNFKEWLGHFSVSCIRI